MEAEGRERQAVAPPRASRLQAAQLQLSPHLYQASGTGVQCVRCGRSAATDKSRMQLDLAPCRASELGRSRAELQRRGGDGEGQAVASSPAAWLALEAVLRAEQGHELAADAYPLPLAADMAGGEAREQPIQESAVGHAIHRVEGYYLFCGKCGAVASLRGASRARGLKGRCPGKLPPHKVATAGERKRRQAIGRLLRGCDPHTGAQLR